MKMIMYMLMMMLIMMSKWYDNDNDDHDHDKWMMSFWRSLKPVLRSLLSPFSLFRWAFDLRSINVNNIIIIMIIIIIIVVMVNGHDEPQSIFMDEDLKEKPSRRVLWAIWPVWPIWLLRPRRLLASDRRRWSATTWSKLFATSKMLIYCDTFEQ